MKHILIFGALGALVAGTVYFFVLPVFNQRASETVETNAVNAQESTTLPPTAQVTPKWDFRLIEDGVSDALSPQTDVAVSFEMVRGAEKYSKGPYRLGTFEGSCSEQPKGEYLSRSMCWFAGAGTEFVIVQKGNDVLIQSRGVDEGSAEEAAIEQSFETVLTVSSAR